MMNAMRSVTLSSSEYRVLRAMLVDGAPNQTIAHRMFIAVDTVKTTLRHAYRKMGCSSRAGIAIMVYSGEVDVTTYTENRREMRHLLWDLRELRVGAEMWSDLDDLIMRQIFREEESNVSCLEEADRAS